MATPRKKREGIMLAYPYERRRLENPKFKWQFPVIVQPKLDGERCRVHMDHYGTIRLFSSTSERIRSVPHIEAELEALWPEQPGIEHVQELDGELYLHGLDFNEIHSIVSRTKELHPDFAAMQLHLFDFIPVEPTMRQMKRSMLLSQMFKDSSIIKVVRSSVAGDVETVEAFLNDYESQGYEGIIVRHPDLLYERKRSTWMLKFKPKKTDTYQLVRIEEAISKDGQPLQMAGALVVSDESQEFKVGCGRLSHEERRRIFNDETLEGNSWVTIQYQTTQPKTNIPRFGLAVSISRNLLGPILYGSN